jgi:hypothetical protein
MKLCAIILSGHDSVGESSLDRHQVLMKAKVVGGASPRLSFQHCHLLSVKTSYSSNWLQVSLSYQAAVGLGPDSCSLSDTT